MYADRLSNGPVPMSEPPPSVEFGVTSDGLTQLRRRWAVPDARASVLIVHGIGEHSGRYLHLGARLAVAGFDVLAADNRGFGQSGGRRAYVERFEDFAADLEELLDQRRSLALPVVAIGHSLGGLILASYLVSDRPSPDLAVLSAPALAAIVPAWKRWPAPALGRVLPRLFVPTAIEGDLLSRDPAIVQAYRADPLVVRGATARLGAAMLAAMNEFPDRIDRLSTPTYVLHGGADPLVPASSSEFLEQSILVERRVWPGLRHECFNEPERDEVIDEMLGWLDRHLASDGEGRTGSPRASS